MGRKSVLLMIAAAAWLIATPVLAQPGPGGFGGRGGGPMGRGPGGFPFLRGLTLTDQQQTSIKNLMDQNRDAMRAVAQQVGTARRELQTEIFADVQDGARITAAKAKVAAAESNMLNAQTNLEALVAQLLTPEQRKQVRERTPPGPPNQ